MRAVKDKDTAPEMLVRRLIFSMGYRYRLHQRGLPGKPDIVFPRNRKIIFVHGCFWHGHPCVRGKRVPKTNTEYWRAKIDRNITRDKTNRAILESQGWDVLLLWECQLNDKLELASALIHFLNNSNPNILGSHKVNTRKKK